MLGLFYFSFLNISFLIFLFLNLSCLKYVEVLKKSIKTYSNMKILVVDEFATNIIIINSILKELGYENILDISNNMGGHSH